MTEKLQRPTGNCIEPRAARRMTKGGDASFFNCFDVRTMCPANAEGRER